MNLHDEIAKAAYELYEKSGKIGRDLENWLEAEKIIMARYGKKGLAAAAKQMEQVAETAGKKVKEAVKETITSLKTAAKKDLKKNKP